MSMTVTELDGNETGNVIEVKVDLCLGKYFKVSFGDWLLSCPLGVEVLVACRPGDVPPLPGVELVQVDHRGPLAELDGVVGVETLQGLLKSVPEAAHAVQGH